MSNAEVVRTIYRDFMAGNAAGILEMFDPRVEFRLAEGHPYRGSDAAWIGKDVIMQKFFAVAAAEWDGWSIALEDLLETAAAVVVEGRYTGTYKPTGHRMDVQVCHVWRFGRGKVTAFHQYLDTARLQHVMGVRGGDGQK